MRRFRPIPTRLAPLPEDSEPPSRSSTPPPIPRRNNNRQAQDEDGNEPLPPRVPHVRLMPSYESISSVSDSTTSGSDWTSYQNSDESAHLQPSTHQHSRPSSTKSASRDIFDNKPSVYQDSLFSRSSGDSVETDRSFSRWLPIVKETDIDQRSEHINMGSQEDVSSEGDWKASGYDTSSLTVQEIHKLKKKGINPALYAEMKAAKKKSGRKWVSPLASNSFL